MEFWLKLFDDQGFMPRRACGLWDASLIWLHVVSDTVIWLSYLWIPLVMLWSYRANKNTLRLHTPTFLILLLYAAFITACGWTHFFDALMFFNPVYRVNGLVRGITALVSLATAISLVWLFPLAVTAPVTILTQKAALRERYAWLRDILDSATNGVLKLRETRTELPDPRGKGLAPVEVASAGDLRAVRKMVHELARTTGLDPARTNDLTSAVHEAAMNALGHAGGGVVRGFSSDEGVQVWVQDHGAGIPLDRLPISTLKQGYSTAGTAGQGWFLVLSFVDAAYLLTGAEGTTLVLEMSRREPVSIPFSSRVGGDVVV